MSWQPIEVSKLTFLPGTAAAECRMAVAAVFAVLLALSLPAAAAGQPATLLADINVTANDDSEGTGGYISTLREAAGKLYFLTSDGSGRTLLWVSDGTPTGTEIIRDSCPAPCSRGFQFIGRLGKLMMLTADGTLWRSDGTRPGTFSLGVSAAVHAFYRGSLYFATCSSGEGATCELGRTDGTIEGTQSFGHTPRLVSWLHAGGDRLYYVEGNPTGSSLWVTDGTGPGTRLHDFVGEYAWPSVPTVAAGRLYFFASENGEEVWTSDGTAAGTRPLTGFTPAFPFSAWHWLKASGARVYFVADDGVHGREIWRTDGSPAGTLRVTEVPSDGRLLGDDQPSFMAVVGSVVLFTMADRDTGYPALATSRGTPGTTALLPIPCGVCRVDRFATPVVSGSKAFFFLQGAIGPELWSTDGTAAGTRLVRAICANCEAGPQIPWNGGVLFRVRGSGGSQIWFSDGTAGGTRPFTNLVGASPLANELEVVPIGGNAYFFAETEERSQGLWVRDASGATRPVVILEPSGPSSYPDHLMDFQNRLFFTASDGTGDYYEPAVGLWTSAGTAETTYQIDAPNVPWAGASRFVKAAGLLFFQVGETYEPHNLWRTDGTPEGTFVVAHLQGAAVAAPFAGALYFFDGGWIWKSDGTIAGTVKTGDFPPELADIESAVPGPNGLYLKGVTAPYRTEFWFTDGTTAGTRQITNFNDNGVTGLDPELTPLGSFVYFTFRGLWRTDGTAAGTSQIAIPGLPPFVYPKKLVAHQGALYFFTAGSTSEVDFRLWRLDGATAVELGRFPVISTFDFPSRLTPFGGKLYFDATDRAHGLELWSTDGTAAGTALLRDTYPGPGSSSTTELTAAGDRLFFAAGDDVHGRELWQSDGTAAGTRLVHDIAPQAWSSNPEQLTVAAGSLFFTADDGLRGREVWVLPLTGSTACRPTSTRLCLGGGRYAVEATWRDFSGHEGVGRAAVLTADTGYFWFFDPANVEVVLKVLDGSAVNGHAWVFYGALSSVEYTLTVTDTQTGLTRRYLNPSGLLASVGDTKAFGPLGAAKTSTSSVAIASPPAAVVRGVAAPAGACAPNAVRLCLNGGRFAVEVAWQDFQGNTGVGQAGAALTADTGWFWFFDAANVEVILKVLDGRPVNGHHWVFYGALSSVQYTVTVTDTLTGKINTYSNPSGRLASIADTEAF